MGSFFGVEVAGDSFSWAPKMGSFGIFVCFHSITSSLKSGPSIEDDLRGRDSGEAIAGSGAVKRDLGSNLG